MVVFKCKMCGGSIEFEQGATVGVCDSCGTKQTLPRLDDERRVNLYDRANHFRRNNEYDKASGIYEQILNEDTSDAEAYWSLVLCRYGIEYVEDPASHKIVPTVNRAQFTSVFDDANYKSALNYADSNQRIIYEEEANAINEIQKGILAISQKEDPFDVFICYKETDQSGRRTPDSVLATELYYQLKQEGFKVFFSRITLEDKLGSAYEPYIFAALNSAKVMVVIGTKPEFLNSPWVKNEWSRYLTLVRESGGKKTLIPAYRDMDPYDLPEEFSHLQAQDMSKLGFMQDLIRGIKKITNVTENNAVIKETIVNSGSANVEPLLKRVFMFLEDGEWEKADSFCEQVLNQAPENAQAYIGKLMAELQVSRQDDLANCERPFETNNNYQKALRFGDEKTKTILNGYIDRINERNENKRLTEIYNAASAAMNAADSESKLLAVSRTFNSISGFRDSSLLAQKCIERAEVCRKNGVYANAINRMNENTVSGYEAAIGIFNTISGWRDSYDKIVTCQNRINEIKLKEEAERLERERKEEEKRIAARKAAIRLRKIAIFFAIAIVICIVFAIVLIKVIIPQQKLNEATELIKSGNYEEGYARLEELGHSDLITANKYSRAVELMNSGEYEAAIRIFEGLNYKDSEDLIEECNLAIISNEYYKAMALMNSGEYEAAIRILEDLDYKDSKEQIEKCNAAIKDAKYQKALSLIETGDYDTAYSILDEIGKHDVVTANKYDRALALMNTKSYEEAIVLFIGLNYKDSESLREKCQDAIKEQNYNKAVELMNVKDFEGAQELFSQLGNYRDSTQKKSECIFRIQMSNNGKIKVGSIIKFGFYEQDNNQGNGKEEIEWIVLKVQNNKAFIVSRYLLDYQPYNTTYKNVTWQSCSLRKWLNKSFYNAAFSSYHKNAIFTTTVKADKYAYTDYGNTAGKNTRDKVFLLSVKEAGKYFKSKSARKCELTAYCKAKGEKDANMIDYSCWWLRSTGNRNFLAGIVQGTNSWDEWFSGSGEIDGHGCSVDALKSIRPAMWINIKA